MRIKECSMRTFSQWLSIDCWLNTKTWFDLFPIGIFIETVERFCQIRLSIDTVWCYIDMFRFKTTNTQKIFKSLIEKIQISFDFPSFPLTKHARSSLTFPQINNSVSAELNLTASATLQSPSPLMLFERISRLKQSSSTLTH